MRSSWLHELSGLIRTTADRSVGSHIEVRFRCGDSVHGVDLATGAVTAGDGATSELIGDEESLESLVRGDVSLQAAFRSGRVVLSGDPEPFLRLSIILDGARASGAVRC